MANLCVIQSSQNSFKNVEFGQLESQLWMMSEYVKCKNVEKHITTAVVTTQWLTRKHDHKETFLTLLLSCTDVKYLGAALFSVFFLLKCGNCFYFENLFKTLKNCIIKKTYFYIKYL